MRLVVLLCGVIAGIVGLGFGWWGEPAALVDIYRLPTPLFAAAVLAIHVVSAASIAGGVLVLANPRVGGMMMLASATIWLLIVALLGGGLGVSMAALIGIGAGGGLLAFLPSLSRAAYRLQRADDEPRILTAGAPDFVSESRPEIADEPEEAEAGEQPAAYNWRGVILDTTEDHSRPFEPAQWRFEEPDLGPVEVPPEPEPAPPSPPPPPPREPPRVADPQPWLSREDRNEHRAAYEIHHGQIRPLTLRAARKKRTRGRTMAGLAALGVLIVGLPTLLVVDHQMRRSGDPDPQETVAAASDVVAAETAADAGTPAAAGAPDISVEPRLAAGALPEFSELATASTIDAPVGPIAALPTLPAMTAAYQTPFDYCAAAHDVDAPDASLMADGLPDELVAGVREVTKIADAEVVWRCMGSAVWVCAQPVGGVACGKVPTSAERQAYCAAHPDATDIDAAAGRWSCDGIIPVVPGGDQRTTDPRGFDRLAWLGLSKAPKPSGSG